MRVENWGREKVEGRDKNLSSKCGVYISPFLVLIWTILVQLPTYGGITGKYPTMFTRYISLKL